MSMEDTGPMLLTQIPTSMTVGFTVGQGGREKAIERGEERGRERVLISLHLCRYSGSDTKIDSKPLPEQQGATLPPFVIVVIFICRLSRQSKWQVATCMCVQQLAFNEGNSDKGAEQKERKCPANELPPPPRTIIIIQSGNPSCSTAAARVARLGGGESGPNLADVSFALPCHVSLST